MQKLEAELQIFQQRAEIAKGNDNRLARLMTDMEHTYQIPAMKSLLENWSKATTGAAEILQVYRYISSLRDI